MEYDLRDLIDIGKLQELTDDLFDAASIPSAIVAIDGEILTGSGWQRICTDFHRQHPLTQKECSKSDTKIRKMLDTGDPFVIYKCPHGMVDASSPIVIAGKHVANVFSGQVFFEPPDDKKEKFFKDQARKFGFNEIEYINAFREVPIFTEEKFRSALSFLVKLSQMIAQMGHIRLSEIDAANALQDASSKVEQRARELNCLYTISKLAEDKTLTIDSLMQSVVDLIPTSFQYPGITCAIASLDNTIYKTQNYTKTIWEIASTIRVRGKESGYLKVVYLNEKSVLGEGPFLKEERYLINSVCKSIGKIIDRIKLTRELKEIEARYQILTNQFVDGIVIIQDGKYKFVNKSFLSIMGWSDVKDLLNKKYKHFVDSHHLDQYENSVDENYEKGLIQDGIEYILNQKSGEKIWVKENRNLIDWENRPALLCTISDITEKKRQEFSSKKVTQELRDENIRLRSSLRERFRFQNIIGKSDAMQQVYDLILNAANSDANVSIYGESGTGKEMVANAIHDLSPRNENFFVPVNCGAIPEQLLESEFFGYKKGAFTGAGIDKHGYLDLADKGSLFLDEIGEFQLNMQVKLLRAIDGGGYHPIGSNEKRQSDFRIITATNKDLKSEVTKGNMREDFYYRVHVIPITIPPLRERKDDIPYLVEHFSKMYSSELKFRKIPEKFLDRIYTYNWPGNVRELQNVLLRYFSTGQFELLHQMDSLPSVRKTEYFFDDTASVEDSLRQRMEDYEKNLILNTLKEYNWHRSKASAKLGITRNTLFRKMDKYGLNSIHT